MQIASEVFECHFYCTRISADDTEN